MDIPSILAGLLSSDNAFTLLEDLMELPPCPLCKEGHILPLSDEHAPFALWICSAPGCPYVLSRSSIGETYYKGIASTSEKDKDGKKWTEYRF